MTGHQANLLSPVYTEDLSPMCFDFWYHILGPDEKGRKLNHIFIIVVLLLLYVVFCVVVVFCDVVVVVFVSIFMLCMKMLHQAIYDLENRQFALLSAITG